MIACTSCGTRNPDGAKFCNQCGTRLAPGASAPAGARPYTPRHLADKILTSRAALIGERKRVTVLFADIKGSTRLAEQAGPERWHEILDRFFAILAGAVHRCEGTVNQYTGDGIMALFGAPVAHEDHALRACLAALAMQREVRAFGDELRLRDGLNLTMRVGLNTGEVVVGRIGDDLRMDYTAQGHTVNLAARMEHVCEPGHIYMTRQVAALAEGYFKLRSLGRMEVAGIDAPIEVFDLEGEGPARTRLSRALARGASRFIGRARELDALKKALDRARDGGQVVAVTGNAGIGKSRLCHEFVEVVAAGGGVAVHRASCVPYAGALPLYPVQTLLKSRLGLPDNASDADIKRLVAGTFLLQDPANAALLPGILDLIGAGETRQRDPDQAADVRERVLTLVTDWLPRAEGLQVLLVEDLHFADPGSEQFLARLCESVRGSPTLLLVNYRPDYINDWLLPKLDEEIALSALSPADLRMMVGELLGRHPSVSDVVARVCERANGNPYFAEEAVQALADEGYLQGQRGAYVMARSIDKWKVPDTVHALLAARIDRLEECHKQLLQDAAVIGREFPAHLLAHLAQAPVGELEDGLEALETSGFVNDASNESERRFAFCHPLMQEVAYDGQLESRRAAAHARLAQALEQDHPLDGAPSEAWLQIAHHWARAGDGARAGAWHLAAAHWAGGHDLNLTLAQFRAARDALAHAPESPEVMRQRIAARAGLIRMGQFAEVQAEELERAYREAREMAEWCCDTPALAELTLSYAGEHLHRGDARAAVALTRGAVSRAVDAGAPELVERFRVPILMMHNAAGHPREGIELVNQAAGQAWLTAPVGEGNFMSRAFYGIMQVWLGCLPEAGRHMSEALAYAERVSRDASWMHANFVDYIWFTGENGDALHHAREAVRLAEDWGSAFFKALAYRALGKALCMHGQPQQAIPFLEQARAMVAPGGPAHQFEANYLPVLSEAYLGAGRVNDAAETAQAAVVSAQRSGSQVWEIAAWLSFFALPDDGPWAALMDEGFERMRELLDSTGAEGFRPWWLLARSHRARDQEERRMLYEQAADAFAAIGAPVRARRLRGSRAAAALL